jgi:hypothetical protein
MHLKISLENEFDITVSAEGTVEQLGSLLLALAGTPQGSGVILLAAGTLLMSYGKANGAADCVQLLEELFEMGEEEE